MSSEEQMKNDTKTTVEENKMDTSEGGNEDERKLFVGGLPQDVKDSDLTSHFSAFGEIEGVNLKIDLNTGRSRGFGFVIYKSKDSVEKAVVQEEHEIKGKKVAVKKAQAKQGKVYVGKLKPELTDEEIKEYFETFGTIASLEQPFDKTKNERKNFCFITYEKEETAIKLLKEGTVSLNGHELEVKKVTPKNDSRNGSFGGRGGRGGGHGWGGNYGWTGYGDVYGWGGYGPADYYAGWGGYGAGGMPYGGKTRGGPGGGPRGRGAASGQRTKPY